MRYRTKPVEIEAIQWDGTLDSFINISNSFGRPECFLIQGDSIGLWLKTVQEFRIQTLEGVMDVSPGDFVIRGLKGEFYPCKPDVFHMKYEEISGVKS